MKVGERGRLRGTQRQPDTNALRSTGRPSLDGHARRRKSARAGGRGRCAAHRSRRTIRRLVRSHEARCVYSCKSSTDPLAFQQAAVVCTPGMEKAPPLGSPQSLDGVDFFTYEKAGGIAPGPAPGFDGAREYSFTLGGGGYGSSRWTIDGAVYPDTASPSSSNRICGAFQNETSGPPDPSARSRLRHRRDRQQVNGAAARQRIHRSCDPTAVR